MVLLISLAIVCALRTSAALLPIIFLFSSKNSGVVLPLALKPPPMKSSNLSIFVSTASVDLFLFAMALIVAPTPPIKPVNNAPSVPNFTLFTKSLVISSSLPLSNSVGPPIKSPKVPILSTSATKAPSATPLPNVPTA